MRARYSVVAENHGRAINVSDHHIHVSIVKQVADRQAAGYAFFKQRWAGLLACIAESSIALVQLQKLWFAVTGTRWQRIDLRINVSANRDKVQPSIVIEIDEGRSPLYPWQRR